MLRCGWEGEPASDWGYTVEAEFTVCLVLLPLETFNSLKAHLAPGPESAASHAPCRGSLRLLHGPPSWHTPARRPFRLGALGQVEGAIHCPSLENTGQPQIHRHQSKSSLWGGVGNRTGLGGVKGDWQVVNCQCNGCTSILERCSGFFCKVLFFIDPIGPGILMSLANVESQEPVAEVQSKGTRLNKSPSAAILQMTFERLLSSRWQLFQALG